MIFNIAIDGPSGAGKSTIAKYLAEKLNISYLDTGAMYRALACYVLEKGITPDDVEKIESLLPDIDMEVYNENGIQQVVVCGKNYTPYIRKHEISMAASTVSKIPSVRKKLVALQQSIAKKTSCVLDGRDICSVVLPDAKYKFFVTAKAEIRAKRRYDELLQKGQKVEYKDVLNDVIARDKQDTERETTPLKQTEDAVLVDTSDMNIDEVIEYIERHICE